LIVSPRDFRYTKDKYPVVFDKGEKIYFYSLYNWENTISDVDSGIISRIGRLLTFSKQLPCITWRLWKEMASWDSMVSVATPYPPVGILANMLGYLRRKKRIFWIDTDIEGFWEWQMKSAPIYKALYLKLTQIIYSTTVGFCVHTSQLTWASGDDVVMRYRNRGNVVKVGWAIPENGIISVTQLEEKVASVQEGNLKLMTASSLYPMKGIQYAVEAARIFIKEMGIPATLDIYGDGHMRSILEHMVEQYELTDAVHFRGTVPYGDQFFACLSEHDCVLIPDLPGPLSRTLFDALGGGTAVIASDTEAYKGIVSDGWDALLVAPGDSAGIAAAVERLHGDRKLLSEIIRNGTETAKRYTARTPSQSC
jgi:glycosyltransferase involved in cell wall biosynthesis